MKKQTKRITTESILTRYDKADLTRWMEMVRRGIASDGEV